MILISGLPLVTVFFLVNYQYLNFWKCGQQYNEIKGIIITKEWHIHYLLTFDDNWSSIGTIEKLPNHESQKQGWVKKQITFFLSCFKVEQLHSTSSCTLNSMMKGIIFGCLFRFCWVNLLVCLQFKITFLSTEKIKLLKNLKK